MRPSRCAMLGMGGPACPRLAGAHSEQGCCHLGASAAPRSLQGFGLVFFGDSITESWSGEVDEAVAVH